MATCLHLPPCRQHLGLHTVAAATPDASRLNDAAACQPFTPHRRALPKAQTAVHSCASRAVTGRRQSRAGAPRRGDRPGAESGTVSDGVLGRTDIQGHSGIAISGRRQVSLCETWHCSRCWNSLRRAAVSAIVSTSLPARGGPRSHRRLGGLTVLRSDRKHSGPGHGCQDRRACAQFARDRGRLSGLFRFCGQIRAPGSRPRNAQSRSHTPSTARTRHSSRAQRWRRD